MSVSTQTKLLIALTIVGFSASLAEAQYDTNAAKKAQTKMQQQYSRSGSIGGGYRPLSAWTYQQNARSHARALNMYGQNRSDLPVETAREHLLCIKQNLTATKTEITKLGPDVATEAGLTEHIEKLQNLLADCEKSCEMMGKTMKDDRVDEKLMCEHCSVVETKLQAFENEHLSMMKKLGIELPSTKSGHEQHSGQAKP